MEVNVYLTAFFGNNEVAIPGGYVHSTKGHFFEIVGLDRIIPRQSVSAWELNHNTLTEKEKVFKKTFGYSSEVALAIDQKKGALKAPKPAKAKKVAMLSY